MCSDTFFEGSDTFLEGGKLVSLKENKLFTADEGGWSSLEKSMEK